MRPGIQVKTALAAFLTKLRSVSVSRGGLILFVIASNSISLCTQFLFDWERDYILSEVVFAVMALIAAFAFHYLRFDLLPAISAVKTEIRRGEAVAWCPAKGKRIVHVLFVIAVFTLAISSVMTHVDAGIPWRGFILAFYLSSVFFNFFIIGATGILYAVSVFDIVYVTYLRECNFISVAGRRRIEDISVRFHVATFLGVVLYLAALFGIYVSPGSIYFLKYEGVVRDFWILPMALIIIAYFLAHQIALHILLKRDKEEKRDWLETLHEDEIKLWSETRDEVSAKNVKFLQDQIDRLARERTWAIDVPRMLSIIVPTLIPARKQLAELIMVFIDS